MGLGIYRRRKTLIHLSILLPGKGLLPHTPSAKHGMLAKGKSFIVGLSSKETEEQSQICFLELEGMQTLLRIFMQI